MEMWSGRQTLGSLDKALGTVSGQIQKLEAEIQATGKAIVALEQEQMRRYSRLAKLRLDQSISGEIEAGFNTADRRVVELLEQRDEALSNLQQSLDAAQKEQDTLEKHRSQHGEILAQAAESLDAAEAATQRRLAEDSAFQQQLVQTQDADRVARHAEDKTLQALADRTDKGRPYETDPLFMYLWERSFETSDYSANRVTRYLDKWVAQVCDFYNARPNYSMLLEIPRRMEAHAEHVRGIADHEFAALKELETQAVAADGIDVLCESLGAAQQRVDATDKLIVGAEEEIRGLLERRADFASGDDEYVKQSIDTFASTFQREDVDTLYRYARATSTLADDTLIQDIAASSDQKSELQEALVQHRRIQQSNMQRMQELEQLRHKFKRERYDDIHSSFGNTPVLVMLLNQFLQGAASSDDLWKTIQRQRRYRRIEADPDFGSGGFGRGDSTWRIPFPPSSGRGGGFGKGGSGGGFRTGGGF